ncbi:P-loop containing nucleoside triphosphate hydrolase protein [Gyrodon lividus]|nr:P-loop containing nucleoside triphosphate hydrolase protein [Gyrodon lividus]
MEERLSQVLPIDTAKLTDVLLRFLAKSSMDSFQRDHLKPNEVTHAFATSYNQGKKQLHAQADRYQHKIRKGQNQVTRIHVSASSGVGGFTVAAQVASTGSDSAQLDTDGHLAGKPVATITLIGREDPTAAEVKRAQIILMVLQGRISAEGTDFNPWIHKIFLDPGTDFEWPAEWSQPAPSSIKFNPSKIPRPLNRSQRKAIRCMLDQTDSSRITIIQGPPGTGKTTVIASYVQAAVAAGLSGIWLIAQSNVAVKNIAEKLADFGLTYWKLLVSNDFYVYWHEHLYTNIRANIITSGEFSDRLSELHSCPVVLCTLSMLSSGPLKQLGAFRMVPMQTIVVDEASQIEIGDYIPLFSTITTIRKAIFIGDDKQLPPHGQADIQELQSIFEVHHLAGKNSTTGKNPIIFLDTQYRMPPQIGNFIAQTVYPGASEGSEPLLNSSEHHPLAQEKSLLCRFVDVAGQQVSHGTSWKNVEECKAIVQLASIFQQQGKKFKIITPYDAQRALIENELKVAELKWGDTCFNVDSFQGKFISYVEDDLFTYFCVGNEEDYIVISLVRSRDLGFLEDKRRMNVMLSRCKRGMVIFTNKAYITKYAGPGKSLIGELILNYYEGDNGGAWVEVGKIGETQFV